MTWGKTFWLWWLIIMAGTGLTAEIIALIHNARNTFSFWVWHYLQIDRTVRPQDWSAIDALVFGLWCVLITWSTVHFFLHRWT